MPWEVNDKVLIELNFHTVLQDCIITAIDYHQGFCLVREKSGKETVHQIDSIICPYSNTDLDDGTDICTLEDVNQKRCDDCPNNKD